MYTTSFTAIVVIYVFLVPTTTSARINYANRSTCVGENVTIPFKSEEICTNPRSALTIHSGEKITHSTAKFLKVKEKFWIVIDVNVGDGGVYVIHLSCDEGIRDSTANVIVDCKRLSVASGAPMAELNFMKPLFNGKRMDELNITIVHTHFKNGESFTVFENGNFTEDAFKYFGKSIAMDVKTHTLILKNVKKKHEGNYTSIWSAEKDHVRVTAKFTLVVTVQEVQSTPGPTLQPQTGKTNFSYTTGSARPTGKPQSGGKTKITMNTVCFIISILALVELNLYR